MGTQLHWNEILDYRKKSESIEGKISALVDPQI